MKSIVLARILTVALIALAILFPIGLIKGKVSERQARAERVVQQFAAETARSQVLAGPFLAATCEETIVEERQVMRSGKAETVTEPRVARCPPAFFVPKSLRAIAALPVESRHRGIYPIRLYRGDIQLSGEIEWPAPPAAAGANTRAWKRLYLVTSVSDARGIKAIESSTSPSLLAAADDRQLAQFAIREDLGDYASHKRGARLPFAYKMVLVGTSSLQIAPIGDLTEIRMASNWPHPSFSESWTPDERRIGDRKSVV